MERLQTNTSPAAKPTLPQAKGRRNRPRKRQQLPAGAAASMRASAGMGLEDTEPTEWLFGDSLLAKGS